MTKKELKKGFTLVELTITLFIIAFLAGLGFEMLLKPAMGVTLDGTVSDFIQFFQYVQARNETFATSTSNVYYLRFANTAVDSDYYASYIGTPETNMIDRMVLLQNVMFTSPTSENNIDLHFCYGSPDFYWDTTNPKPRLLCDASNEIICDTNYTITVKTSMFSLTRSLLISTSSTDECVPKLTRQ